MKNPTSLLKLNIFILQHPIEQINKYPINRLICTFRTADPRIRVFAYSRIQPTVHNSDSDNSLRVLINLGLDLPS